MCKYFIMWCGRAKCHDLSASRLLEMQLFVFYLTRLCRLLFTLIVFLSPDFGSPGCIVLPRRFFLRRISLFASLLSIFNVFGFGEQIPSLSCCCCFWCLLLPVSDGSSVKAAAMMILLAIFFFVFLLNIHRGNATVHTQYIFVWPRAADTIVVVVDGEVVMISLIRFHCVIFQVA